MAYRVEGTQRETEGHREGKGSVKILSSLLCQGITFMPTTPQGLGGNQGDGVKKGGGGGGGGGGSEKEGGGYTTTRKTKVERREATKHSNTR